MVKVIAFSNQKGGVGKTTSVSEVAENLSQEFQQKVLMVDLDPQASLTDLKDDMNEIINGHLKTMYDVMEEQEDMKDVIRHVKNNLDLAPATLKLSDAEIGLVNATAREMIFTRTLNKIKNNYDFVLVDCPPSRGILTVNALTASDTVIIPVQSEYQALVGIALLKDTIREVQNKDLNRNLKIMGYIITMITHTNHSKEVIGQIEEDETPIIAKIPRSIDVSDASLAKKSTYDYNPTNKAGQEYYKLSKFIRENY